MNIKSYLPILEWLPRYSSVQLKGDVSAGLTVGVMLIPQGMAYSMLAGLPPIYGLYASTLPLIIYAIFGTSRQLAVGPVAMVSLLTASGVGVLAQGGTEAYLTYAVVLALMVGIIQFALGAFRLGFLVSFLSHPVISGFTSAAAIIIGLSQLKHLLGIQMASSEHVHEVLLSAAENIAQTNFTTLSIGLAGIGLILGVRRINRAIPGPLLAVVFGILLVWGLGLTEQGVKIVGEVPDGLPAFVAPAFTGSILQQLLPTALAISLVSFMESIAVAKAIQARHKNYQVVPNQELVGLGLANIGGAFIQSFPVTGGFSRTAVNDQAGAQTGLASIISAALIVLTLLVLTPLFYYLPQAILASVIMVAVFGLIDVREPLHLWHTHRGDFWMLIVTFGATLVLGIEQGIGIGVVLSLGMLIFRSARPHVAVLGQVPGTRVYRNRERFPDVEDRPDILIVRFDAELYFANVDYFLDRLDQLMAEKGKPLTTVILNCESISSIDSTALHALDELYEKLQAAGIRMLFTGLIGPVRDALARSGVQDRIGADHFFLTVHQAVESSTGQQPAPADERLAGYTLQTNP